MTPVFDDQQGVYYWVDADGRAVSPHFDYQEDAEAWYHQHNKSDKAAESSKS
jgi:hypothetical protein